MRVSTMTNLFHKFEEGREGYLEAVKLTNDAGFKVMDFCMCPMQRNETELNGDDWRALTARIAEEGTRRGVEFNQSHLPYAAWKGTDPTAPGCEKNEWFVETTKRCIEISAMLGVEWAVVHPVTHREFPTDIEKNIAYNHEIFDQYVELGEKLGVGIAFENMCDQDSFRRFGVTANELCLIVDSYKSDYVGACWDFGHANRAKLNQANELRMLGSRLKATHVDDNIGQTDLHTIPYFGTVKWTDLMPILTEIGYEGDFNFELSVCKRMPEELYMPTAKYVHMLGEYLVSLA